MQKQMKHRSGYDYLVMNAGSVASTHTSLWAAKAKAHALGQKPPYNVLVWDRTSKAWVKPEKASQHLGTTQIIWLD